MLLNIWSPKYNMEEKLQIILIENFLTLLLMITLKIVSSEMNILSLKSSVKVELELQKKDINIKSLLIPTLNTANISNTLILSLLLITLKSLDSI